MEYPTIRKRRTGEFVSAIHSQFAAFLGYRCGYISPPLVSINGCTQFLLQQNSNVACKYPLSISLKSLQFSNSFPHSSTECFQFNYVPDVFNYFRSLTMSCYKGSSSAIFVLWHIIFHCINLFYLNAHRWRRIARRHQRGMNNFFIYIF